MSQIMRIAPPSPRVRPSDRDGDGPGLGAFVESLLYAIDGMVIGGTVCPGLLLCVPAILFVVVPVVAVGALVALVAAALAAPVVGVVLVARLVARHPVRVHLRLPARPRVRRPAARGALVAAVRSDRHA